MTGCIDGIVTLFREQLNVEITDYDADLVDEGLIDSLMLVDLLVFLESAHQITIALEDLEIDNFRTISSIVQFVEAKQPRRIGNSIASSSPEEPKTTVESSCRS